MIKKILNIADTLHQDGFSSKKCAEALSNIETSLNLEEFNKELGDWLLCNQIPRQLNVYNHFGQPPVTIYNNDEFVIDIYFWMHADTSLHSHAFNGAFKILYGKSLHEEFKIESKETYSNDIQLNQLTRTKSELLKEADVREIVSGNTFNHRVVHLSAPTVTLCIRSVKDLTVPQWHYFDNGLSILKRELDESIFKKIFYADYLSSFSLEQSTNFTHEFISKLELSESMNLFEQLTVDTMGLSEAYQQILFNIMMSIFNNTKWFHLYEEACDRELIQAQDDTEEAKLIAHLNNHAYTEKEATVLFSAFSR